VSSFSSSNRSLETREFNRILLIKPSSLGDVVHALPVLHGLRVRFPKATVDWLVGTSFAPLLEGHPEIDELVPFDRKRYGRMLTSPSAALGFLQFVRMLRKRRYDLVIDLQGLFRSGFLSRASGAPVRIGFRQAREGARTFYTHCLTTDEAELHAVDRNYLVAKALGFADVAISFPLPPGDQVSHGVRKLLAANGVGTDCAYLALAPGARWETKVWPADHFVQTIEALRSQRDLAFVLVGGMDEFPICEKIRSSCGRDVVNLAGKTSLPELTALVASARAVLCHDSAVAHLAVALERPLVCLVGPTNPRRTGPYRRLCDVVQLPLDCTPCYFRRITQCPHNHRCMNELPPSTVVSALRAAVDSQKTLSNR